MDAGGGAGAGAGAAAASGSYGLVRAVVGYSTSPLFFWLLTVALVAAIHIASATGSKPPSRSEEKERERRRKKEEEEEAWPRGLAAAGEESGAAAAPRNDDRVLQMMRSFSFVQATEEDFMENMAAYEYDRGSGGGTPPPEVVAPEPFAPSPAAASLSFRFQHQTPEIPRRTTVVLREIHDPEEEEQELHQEAKASSLPVESDAKEPSLRLESDAEQEHGHEAEEVAVEEQGGEEQRRGAAEEVAPSTVVSTTHNYQFLTERGFRGFLREPEAMTVRVQESFLPPSPSSPPAQPEERRVVDIAPLSRSGGFLTERDFLPADEADVCASVASSGRRTPSLSRKPADEPDVCESLASSGRRTPSLSRKPADEPDVCESLASSGRRTPSRSQKPAKEPDVNESVASLGRRTPSRRQKPAKEHDVYESVASSGRRTPPRSRKPASSPHKGSAVGGRMSFASEFSGFGDSDSESSGSDGYSVKELVVDSDSDWFLSEKDFPASARNSGNLKGYKAKVLKAIEALEEAAKLERSFQDTATTVSPGSAGHRSPDSIPDGSPGYPEDLWSRSPSPDVEYIEDEAKVAREAETQYEEDVEQKSTADEEGSILAMSDDEHSLDGEKPELAPVYDAAPVADNSMVDHSEKETITLHDHSGEAVADVQRSPVSERELAAVSSYQAADPDDKRRSPEPLEKEFVGTVDHSLEHCSDKRETASESEQSYEIVFDDKRRPEPLEAGFVGTNDHSHEPISDVWKEIVSRNDEPSTMAHPEDRGLNPAEEEFAGTDDHSKLQVSHEKKVTFSTTNDQLYALSSDDKSISLTPEQEFSATDHPYGVVPDAKNISEAREDEEHATADDRLENAIRQGYVSATGKAKVYDDDGEDPEAKWKDLTEEEEDELESLWEHQDLIEQLKLELKKVKSIGLPTILEESETPKAPMEDLKPWRIDAKFLREDPMDELNKFYKSYRERMRKFDILCYQKMYAIDFLQLRGPQQSSTLKSLSPTVTSILSHNFRPSRRRSPEDPSERFLKELRYDLETVYVGQMCLSWEFLRWQYEQARDLPESDPYHSHQYNQVAGEFQQFQVVVQRFVEDESFKGPRLPNYINNRCVLRNLLQVPVIKEDSLKDRMEDQRKGNYVITSEELEDTMEEAMHTLWEFIKADRVETTATSVLKGLSGTHVELQDPSDHDLMAHIHATLQKKEKRLKDLLRTGNCIVKKFKKPKEDRSNLDLFFSQVDMRLVARVLRMPRITSEQLQWCKAKLDKIILVDRKIHREASFLLFPC